MLAFIQVGTARIEGTHVRRGWAGLEPRTLQSLGSALRIAPLEFSTFATIKDVVSKALMGVVLGSGNWSRDSRGARGSSAEEPDID